MTRSTLRRERQAYAVALVLLVALLSGCEAAASWPFAVEPSPDPAFPATVAALCETHCAAYGIASLELTPTSGRCQCRQAPNVGTKPRTGRRP